MVSVPFGVAFRLLLSASFVLAPLFSFLLVSVVLYMRTVVGCPLPTNGWPGLLYRILSRLRVRTVNLVPTGGNVALFLFFFFFRHRISVGGILLLGFFSFPLFSFFLFISSVCPTSVRLSVGPLSDTPSVPPNPLFSLFFLFFFRPILSCTPRYTHCADICPTLSGICPTRSSRISLSSRSFFG